MSVTQIRVGDYIVERTLLDETARELRQYQHRRRRLEYLRLRYQQIPLESPPPGDGMPKAVGRGDPTARAAERLDAIAREMADLAAWLFTVDRALSDLSASQREIIQQIYLRPRHAREFTMSSLARHLNLSEREAYRARNEALLHLALSLHGDAILGRGNCGRNLADIRQS